MPNSDKYPFSSVELSSVEVERVRVEFAQALENVKHIYNPNVRVLYVDALCDSYAFKMASANGMITLASHQHNGTIERDAFRKQALEVGAYGVSQAHIDAVREMFSKFELDIMAKTKVNEIKRSIME